MRTKLENTPHELTEFVAVALRLSKLERGGAKFNYPESLLPFEWASMEGLIEGRDQAESLKAERERREAKIKKRKEELERNG